MDMTIASSASLGLLPMPLRALVDRAVRSGAAGWFDRNLVAKPRTIHFERFQRKSGLTEADMAAAVNAAEEASRRSADFR